MEIYSYKQNRDAPFIPLAPPSPTTLYAFPPHVVLCCVVFPDKN